MKAATPSAAVGEESIWMPSHRPPAGWRMKMPINTPLWLCIWWSVSRRASGVHRQSPRTPARRGDTERAMARDDQRGVMALVTAIGARDLETLRHGDRVPLPFVADPLHSVSARQSGGTRRRWSACPAPSVG